MYTESERASMVEQIKRDCVCMRRKMTGVA